MARGSSASRIEARAGGRAEGRGGEQIDLVFDNNRLAGALYGEFDQNLALIERRLGVDARARGNMVSLSGQPPQLALARRVLESLYDRLLEGKIPACVEGCPGDALLFGTRKELIKEARKRIVENPAEYHDYIYGEHEAGGTSFLYLSAVPVDELGFKTNLQKSSYPALTKGFLYSVPTIFVLCPSILLGIYEATKNNRSKSETHG